MDNLEYGPWKVINNPMAGFGVCSVKNDGEPMNGGNIRTYGYYGSREEAQKVADKLNEESEE